jgi:hypothetical protein
MELSKKMSIAISSLAFAGTAVFGTALPASAQTVSAAPHRVGIAPTFGCFGGFFSNCGFFGFHRSFFFDDCDCDC